MDKELIDHITTQLQNHEEAYSSGAWEGFSEKDKKKNGFAYWPLWSAAALILIFGGIFFITDKDAVKNKIAFQKPKSTTENRVPEVKKEKHNDQKINHKDYKNPPNEEIFVSALKDKHNGSLILLNKAGNIGPNPASNTVRILSYNILENKVSDYNLSSKNIQPAEFYTAEKRKPASVSKITFEDLLARDSHTDQFKKTPKISQDSKWQPGIYVAPAMGNDNKVNMNYGFSLSYAIANKLSISSGIAYNALSTTEALDAGAPQTLSGRNLESVDSRVRGINIPLELKYKINDKLYTEIGVSALAVLNNKQQNNYILNQVQNVSYSTANGLADQKTLIVKERTSEPKPEANIDPDRYIGFYNFSFGYKQKISRKKNIAIEPFLRLPMKTFSKDNLNLTNGGLKLKIDF